MTPAHELAKRLRGYVSVTSYARPDLKKDLREAADLLSSPSPAMDEVGLELMLMEMRDQAGCTFSIGAWKCALAFARRLVTVDEWNDDMTAAPKDGTWVLLFSPDSLEPQQFVGQWRDDERDKEYGGAWWADDDGPFCIDADPTHWRPLPPPPQAVSGNGGK